MRKNETIREEEIIVVFTKQQLEENLSLNAESLRKQLLKNYEKLKLTKNIVGMSPKSLENYLVMAKLLRRLSKLREQNAGGSELWTDEDYRILQSSGILLNNCVRTINKLSPTAFLSVLKKVVSKLPCDRSVIDRTVNTEIGILAPSDLMKGTHDEHNNIKDLVGKRFLYDIGCHFVTTEVTLEKGEAPVRGLKIDAYGWKNDGTICGVEVKTSSSDYSNTKVAMRFDRYARYVNEMYILTTDEYAYDDAINWRKRTNHNEVGILLYDKDVDAITKQSRPIETRKEVTSMMLECVQRALLTKSIKLINTIDLQRDDCTPAQAVQTIKSKLAHEILDFASVESNTAL